MADKTRTAALSPRVLAVLFVGALLVPEFRLPFPHAVLL